MNALLAAQPLRLRPLKACDLDRVLAVEQRAYSFPWTRGNFIDALAAGYLAELWVDAHDDLVGYHVAMVGVDELHLLNLTVAPQWQRLGHARSRSMRWSSTAVNTSWARCGSKCALAISVRGWCTSGAALSRSACGATTIRQRTAAVKTPS